MSGLGASGAVVVDASALAAMVFGEPRARLVSGRLGRREMLAPTLLPYEIASIGLKKLRLHPALGRMIRDGLGVFGRLDVRLVAVPTDEVVELAGRESLTAYDAAYLWLARTLGCELVTLDGGLEAAAAGRDGDD